MKKIYFYFLIFITLSCSDKEKTLFVSATNGLNFRNSPSLDSKTTTIPQGTEVIILEKTGILISIIENQKKIKGQWVKVSLKKSQDIGYVFDYYLNHLKPNADLPKYDLEEDILENFYDRLYTNLNNKDTTLLSEKKKKCLRIEKIADFDQNGYNDVLIEIIGGCGGNCCGNSFLIYTYSEKGFSELNLKGYDWDGITIKKINNNYEFTVDTDHEGINTDPPFYKNETFSVSRDSLILKNQYISKKVKAIKEIRSDMFENDDDILSLIYDFDNDNKLDSISCSLWSRWGRMTDCILEFGNGNVQRDLNFQTKRIGVLPSKTNGLNDLVLEFNDTLKWNGKEYKTLPSKEQR